ncbi:MAG: hypothetical protein COZ08_04250, partial [Bacteroidetes bacterium CG_4_10_14_3_um_filter_42_6]
WVVTQLPKSPILKADAGSMWQELLTSMGEEYQYWTKFPINPGMN